MFESPFSRVAKRLRGISQISLQVAQAEVADTEVVGKHPEGLQRMAQNFRESAEILDQYALEEKVSLSHRQEDIEALITLSRTAANVATIIGSDGGNLKVLIFADSGFILEILTDGQEAAIEEAFSKLSPELRKKYTRWMGGK